MRSLVSRPKADPRGVQIGVLPQVVFTEPVKNLPGNVTLTDAAGQSVGISLSGVGPNGPVADLTPTSVVTSITIQPMAGLKYNTVYTLSLSSGIEDTDRDVSDQPAPKQLAAYTTSFTTFAPEAIGRTTDTFTAGGMAVIGDRAYVAGSQNLGRKFTNLRLFDISDPTLPQEVTSDAAPGQLITPPPASWLGLPVDVVGEAESPLTGGTLVAVATNPFTPPFHPANVRLYDTSDDQSWRWIGAVTLGREPTDGMIRRIRLRGNVLYAATAGVGKGIQVIDLGMAQELFNAATAEGEQSAGFWQMQGLLNGSDGFGQQAIAQSIYVDTGSGQNSQLWDLAVTDLTVDEVFQTGVVATGRSPLVIANPQTGEVLYNGNITAPGGEPLTSWGYGIAAGTVSGTQIAVVSTQGIGGAGPAHLLAVVDLTNPRQPVALGTVELPGSAANVHDVVLRGTDVFIGTTTGTLVVSVAEPSQPRLVGTIAGVSGRLSFSGDGLLFGTQRGLTQITAENGGLRSAALETIAVIRNITASAVTRQPTQSQTARPMAIEFALLPPGAAIATAQIDVTEDGIGSSLLATLSPDALTGYTGRATLPAGSRINPGAAYFAQVRMTDTADGRAFTSAVKRMPVIHRTLDLELQGLPEEYFAGRTEEAPGGVLMRNNDDDNDDGIADMDTVTSAVEPDLVPVTLHAAPEILTGVTVTFQTTRGSSNIRAWADANRRTPVASGTSWVVGREPLPSTLYVEGLQNSTEAGDTTLELRATDARGDAYADVVRLSIIEADLDIDSDNNDALDPPGRTPVEEAIEDRAGAGRPGKYVVVNDNDDDVDDVPDFADGYNRDAGAAQSTDDANTADRFVPLVFQLSNGIDLSTALIRFTYSASSPAAVSSGGSQPDLDYMPGSGHLRLWKRNGQVARKGASAAVDPTADFVPSAVPVSPGLLDVPIGSRTVTLFVETVSASTAAGDQRILVEVDPDGSGPSGFVVSDAVRLTAVGIALRDTADNARRIGGGDIAWIAADPAPTMPQLTVRVQPDLGTALSAQWSMTTTYTDHRRNDAVAPSPAVALINQEWDIAAALKALPDDRRIFGGKATVSLNAVGAFEARLQFRIRGRNPSDAVARAFIDSQASPQDQWFAYAIVKHESKDGDQYYHQFYRPGSTYAQEKDTGLPFFRPNPAGWGMAQRDFSSGPAGRPTIAEIWDWHANVISGLQKLAQARTVATEWMTRATPRQDGDPNLPWGRRPRARVANNGTDVPIDNHIVGNCTFTEAGTRMEDAVTMKVYNSVSSPVGSGLPLHYIDWRNGAWVFGPTNRLNNNYVAKVCGEVEPQ